jgi:hypothetical protein
MQKIFPKNNQYSRKDAVIVEWPYDLTGLVSKLQKIDFPLANIGDLWKYYSNLSMEKSEVDESGAGKRKK